ncbi:hypothetical protein C942_00109 [Photobacterium marinum]|uniref:Uncharacterized protein n=1 Tax=Photobacterium marinum TaxID=1056511 RepID=L8JK56_9GAMM|nr:hypothetical protein C942_00109 [Photobacterium marinum]
MVTSQTNWVYEDDMGHHLNWRVTIMTTGISTYDIGNN